MDYATVKDVLKSCPELSGLDEVSFATLFWRGEVMVMSPGDVIYQENTALDDTFGVLLSGDLQVAKDGIAIGEISGPQIFGEMAYFTASHARTATVQANSPDTTILKVQLSQEEMESPRFAALRKYLGLEAWDRFVITSQGI